MDFDKPKVYGDTFISDGLVLNEKYSLKPTRSSKYQNCEVRTGVEKRGQELKNTFFVTTSTTSDAKFGNY